MEYSESIKILEQPKYIKRKIQATTYRLQDMKRNLYLPKGTIKDNELGTTVSGGSHPTRDAQFMELADMDSKYENEIVLLERATKRIQDKINEIYLNNTNKNGMNAYEEVKRQRAELFIIAKYINGMNKWDMLTTYNVSEKTYYRALDDGKDFFYEIMKNEDYQVFMCEIYGNDNN